MLKYNNTKSIDLSTISETLPTFLSKEPTIQPSTAPSRILMLPVELQIRIFALAQNPALATSCTHFFELGQSVTVRAQYLMQRYGPTVVLGKRSMKRKIVSLEVVQQLLRLNRCDPKADGDYWLFTQACEQNQIDLCTWIIEAALSLEQLQDEKRKILARLLNIASMKGAIPTIDSLVEKFGADIHYPNGEETALTLACKENQVETVKHLKYKYGCNVHSHSERHLRTACLYGYKELVEFLLSVGSDVHAYSDASLQNAVYKGFPDVVKVLLDVGAEPNHACIQHAITNGDVESLKYLISAGANPRSDHDWPLKHACRRGLDDIVAYLIEVIPADNVTNIRDGMPLEQCLAYGRVSTVQLLLDHGADPNSSGAIRGLRYAVKNLTKNIINSNTTMIKLLMEAGLDLSRQSEEIHQLLMPAINQSNNNLILSWI